MISNTLRITTLVTLLGLALAQDTTTLSDSSQTTSVIIPQSTSSMDAMHTMASSSSIDAMPTMAYNSSADAMHTMASTSSTDAMHTMPSPSSMDAMHTMTPLAGSASNLVGADKRTRRILGRPRFRGNYNSNGTYNGTTRHYQNSTYSLGFNSTMMPCNGTDFNRTMIGIHYGGNGTINGVPCNGTNGTALPPPYAVFKMKCPGGQVGTFLDGQANGNGTCKKCPSGSTTCRAKFNSRVTLSATCLSSHFLNDTTSTCDKCPIGNGNLNGNTAPGCSPCDSKLSSTCTMIIRATDVTCRADAYLKSGLCTAVAAGKWTPANNKLTAPLACPVGAKTCVDKVITKCLANYKQKVTKKVMSCKK